MHHELVRPALIDDESLPWIPFAPWADAVRLKVFRADPMRGEMIVMVKGPARAPLPCHRHSGSAIVYTIAGRWKYREHDWIAGPGSVVVAPAAARLTPQAVDGGEVVTLNVVRGDVILLDSDDCVIATENWRSMLQRYLDYCLRAGIVAHDITALR